MKKTLLFLFGLFFTIMTASADGDGGWADCAVNLTKDGGASYLYSLGNETWADGEWILNDSFDGYNFGTPSSLVLNGGVGNAWTNDTPGYNPSSFVLYYRVYKTGTMPGSWSQIALDNVNPQNGLNYVFDKTTAGIDVLALATDAGTYILEVAMSKNQFYAGGNWNSMIPGGQAVAYNSSIGGYKATFTKSASIATPTVTGISPSSGTTAGGASVVITGTNFTGVTAVKFGSVNATNFTVNSNTQITATSPAGAAGTVDVTVTTAGGTSATSASDKFTILAAAPSIAYGVNLVVNGDAETGNLTGWTAGGTDAAYFVNDVTTPYGDSAEAGHNRVFDFYGPARKNQEATLSQTIDITALQSQISSGLVSATSSGQIYGWYSDGSASITITELDANNNALLTHTNGLLHQGQRDNYPNTFWTKDIPMMGTLNSNTRKLKITLYAHTSPTITEDFVDFDNIQLILSTVPTVTTSAVTIFDANSATMGGDVAANGGATVTERGFVYSLASNNTNPQIGGAGVTKVAYSSGGTGSFSQSVGSLAAGTLYYVNAYATNSVGTSYGTVTSFTTMVVANPVISVSGVTAGGLSAAITAAGGDLATVTSLTVTGTIDARDFKTMRDAMPNLAELDLSGATIVAGANIDGTAGITNYPANEIPANAFSDGTMGKSSLTSFSMPSTITSIGGMAFNGCSNLTGSLTIPASVNSIGSMAFGGCSMISSIKAYGATPCTGLNLNVFAGMSTSTCILHVPFGTKALYEAADQWKAFMQNIIVDDLVIAPAATTTAASSVTSAGAILNGTVNAYGVSTVVAFEYGLTTSYGNTVTADQIIGTSATEVSYALTGLTPNTNYHYRVVGVNAEGTTNGADMMFSTADIAPNISYVTPQSYIVGTPIAALTPTNTGGAVPVLTSAQVSTLAGSGTYGSADGLGTAASFDGPYLLAPDATGNIYVSDTNNKSIRKITPAGNVSTFGDAAAGFKEPAGIAVDPSGNVYVADNDNHRIRKISPAGVVSTVAGSDSGESGNADGIGTAARFSDPNGLALDAAGNLYVADAGNYLIRKITPAGEVSTFAGSGISGADNGNGTLASFSNILGIAIDAAGNLYVTEHGSSVIRKITPTGDVTALTGISASFTQPVGIAVDGSGNLYVADAGSHLIRKITPAGEVSTLAGSGSTDPVNGAGAQAGFNPYGITVDVAGNVYVADAGNNLIRKIMQSAYTISPALPAGLSFDGATGTISGTPTAASATTTYTVSAANSGGSSTTILNITVASAPTAATSTATSVSSAGATLNGSINANDASTAVTFEYGLTTSYGNTVTADQSPVTGTSATVVSYTLTGLTPNTTYHYRVVGVNAGGTTHGGDMTFSTTDIAPNISYVTPQIYTVGTPIAALTPTNTGGAVVAISSPQVSTLAGNGASGSADGLGTAASFNIPVFLAPDAAGNLYVSDLVNNMIRKITPAGGVSTLADASAGFNKPAGIAVDPSGNLYVADNENHRIRKITPAGVVSTVAGSDNGERGNTNGNGTAARFSYPTCLTLDAAGNLYVSDYGNKQIRKITPAGEVTTFAGSGIFGSTDGNGTSASFKSPIGIVIDASGNLYVADSRSNLIRKISPTGDVSTFAGSGAEGSTNGNGTLASFNAPEGIAIDASGNLYIADSENNLIRKINHAGDVTTLAGSGSAVTDNGAAETAGFRLPYGVTADASGNLYVADTYNNLIRKITQSAYTITPALPAGLSFDGATGTISGTPTAASAATTYTVTAANNGGSSTTTFSIAVKSPQTISFGTLASKTYGDATFDLAATSTSGLAVSYSSDNTAVATVSGNTVTVVGAGTANITATQAGDATNFAAANVTQQLSVSKKALTVMAVADTKTYDGTTASTAVPTVGPQASGDTINVAPTQAFDNATVGTAHVLTASGLTLKKGNANVTANYDISYVSSTGVINKRALTITDPTVVTSKAVDGNTTAVVSSSGTLQNVLSSDLNNVAVTAAANYDNATAGINKTITVVYTLSGSASGNYTAPVNFVITDAKIVDISSGVDAPTVSDAEAVTAYPTQVAMGQSCQVRVSGLTDSDLQGTALSVYNTQGICVYHSTKVGLTNSVALPPVQGVYLGRAITAKGKEFQFKVIVTR